ncbi:MAG TPA: hypothetical protein VIA64_11150 [Burkholderiales bacterium]
MIGRTRAAASLLTLLTLGTPGCASKTGDAGPPEAAACTQPGGRVRARDYAERLYLLTQRADAYAACMSARGFVLDEAKLEAELQRLEQVRNADQLGGDPQLEVALRAQELRASPTVWRKGG